MHQTTTNTTSRRRLRRVTSRFLRWFTILCLVALGASIGLFAALYFSLSTLIPADLSALRATAGDATRIYSSDGVLLARLYQENRDAVTLDKVPEILRQATIAIEDKRFREHYGFDHMGIIRAVLANVRGRGYEQGASTITQQLARNIFLSNRKTFARKFQELTLAIAIERQFTKDQILETYLNQVYYGSGAYGVESAARTYFGKSVTEISLPEAALIAGLTQKPTGYSPYNDPDAAIGRRGVVLDRMLQQGFITDAEAADAKAVPLDLAGRPTNLRWKAPYFVAYVIQQLADRFSPYQQGLCVYTTLDWRMQQEAEKAVRKGVAANRSRRVGEGALVALDPHTGYIRAMVGGTDFDKSQFNVVTQGTPQPGSTFKLFVYTAALEAGYGPYDTMPDEKVWLRGRSKPPWPQNYDRRYHGRVTLKRAVAQSYNVPAVLLAKSVTVDTVIATAQKMGITARLPRDLSLALGSASVPPIQMAQGYCVIANGGDRIEPTAISRITTSNGGVIFRAKGEPEEKGVITESAARNMDDMLRAVVTQGTGRSVARRVSEARGKTGTTDEDRHAWFIGYTPELVTAVWVGNRTPVPMREVWGGNVCAPIWSDFMEQSVPWQRAYARAHPEIYAAAGIETRSASSESRRRPTNRPRTVTKSICDESGLLAGPNCPHTHNQKFPPETVPSAGCDIHGGAGETTSENPEVSPTDGGEPEQPEPVAQPPAESYVTVVVCADTGLVANTNCPRVVRKRFRADLAPTQVCGRH